MPSDSPPNPHRQLVSRRLAYIMLVRVILFTLILGGTVAVNLAWGTPEELGGPYVTLLFVFISAIYVLNIFYAGLLRHLTNLRPLAIAQLVLDLVTSAALVHFTGGAESAFVLFFLLTPIAASVVLDRRGAMLTAAAGVVVLSLVVLMGHRGWLPPLPGQVQLPADAAPGALGRSLLINGSAMVAMAVLSGYLAEQLRSVAERVEVQQAHIDDLAALNVDIVRCLTSGLITVSDEGRILSINRAANEILGLPAGSRATGRSLGELCPELAEVIDDREGMMRSEITIRRGARSRLLGISASPLTDHLNRVRGSIINFQDLTGIREMERTVKRSERMASLGRMAAAIAHEIRNPLASISGSLELLQAEDDLGADNRRLMAIVMREVERLNQLITSFLEYARPRPSTLELLDLGRTIHVLVEGMTELPTGEVLPPIAVTVEESGLWVKADHDQLRAALWNLVLNASEAGERERIDVRVAPRNADIVIEVSDRAAGIPEDKLDQIFEPFFTTKARGTGLGLATVFRIVQEHDGKVEVHSAAGQGTTFSLSLPRAAPPARARIGAG